MGIFNSFNKIIFNYTLLTLVVFTMFFISFFPVSWHGTMYDYCFTLIYINAALTMDKYRKQILFTAFVLMILELGSTWMNLTILSYISKALNIVFFVYIVFNLIYMIANSKKVNTKVILDSINGYLLLGFVFSLMLAVAMLYDSNAFKFPEGLILDTNNQVDSFSVYLYYGLVTLSTLGYGDIVPTMPFSKSLAILTSISGQLYIAIIIAMLVGKFASQKNNEQEN